MRGTRQGLGRKKRNGVSTVLKTVRVPDHSRNYQGEGGSIPLQGRGAKEGGLFSVEFSGQKGKKKIRRPSPGSSSYFKWKKEHSCSGGGSLDTGERGAQI